MGEELLVDVSRRASCLVGAALLVGMSGCSASTAPSTTASATTASGTPVASEALPPGLGGVADDPAAGLRGELLQFRRDVAGRYVEVRLIAGNDGLVVAAAQLMSPDLPAAPADPRGAELRAGTPLDLRVAVGATDCAVDTGPPRAAVLLTDATGASREVTVPLDDGGFAARLHEADCFEEAVRAQVAIEVLGVHEVTGPALDVTVQLRRVGGSDAVGVTQVDSNTIYSITATGPLPVLDGPGAVGVELRLDPSRCDVHALNESYRTSLIGLRVALGDRAARPFVLTPEPAVRHQLEAFAVEVCLGGGG